jgi:D-aspartate ligase
MDVQAATPVDELSVEFPDAPYSGGLGRQRRATARASAPVLERSTPANTCSGYALTMATNGREKKRVTARGAPTPAIVVGGSQNALSVARNLTREGIEVIALNYPYEAVRFSRYAKYVRLDGDGSPAVWERFLLSAESQHLSGSVLLPCSDEAVSIVVNNYKALSRKFLLEETDAEVRRELLDKFVIYQHAEKAGIPTVRYALVRTRDQLDRTSSVLRFPMIIKPLYSPDRHLLKFKAALIADPDELIRRFSAAAALGVGVVLMEYIPGGDDRLCSYYTYLDEGGNPLVHFTKRVKRRYPLESGDGTYHVTDWIPEAADLGLRFFRHIKFRGLGNIEFKWDERDGRLKVIEANARFTASDCLLSRSGVNLALITYNRITGRPQPPVFDYKKSLVLCRPIEDAFAAWSLRKAGRLRLSEWLVELRRADMLPFFEWRDPMPALAVLSRRIWRLGEELFSSN